MRVPVDRVSCPDMKILLLPVMGVPVDWVSCPDTEIQDLSAFGLPVDRGSCPDAEIQVFPDFGLPVDRVSCPDTEIQVLPDFGLPVDRVSSPARNPIRHRKKLSIFQRFPVGFSVQRHLRYVDCGMFYIKEEKVTVSNPIVSYVCAQPDDCIFFFRSIIFDRAPAR